MLKSRNKESTIILAECFQARSRAQHSRSKEFVKLDFRQVKFQYTFFPSSIGIRYGAQNKFCTTLLGPGVCVALQLLVLMLQILFCVAWKQVS